MNPSSSPPEFFAASADSSLAWVAGWTCLAQLAPTTSTTPVVPTATLVGFYGVLAATIAVVGYSAIVLIAWLVSQSRSDSCDRAAADPEEASAAEATALTAAARPPRARKDPPRAFPLVEFSRPTLSAPEIAFYTDECANGLGPALRLVGLNVLTSREAGMDGEKDDRKQLLRAQLDRRILVTFNKRDFRALDGVIPHAGMLLCPQGEAYVPEIQRVCLRLADEGIEAIR